MKKCSVLCLLFLTGSALQEPEAKAGISLYVGDFGGGSSEIQRIDQDGNQTLYGTSSSSPYYLAINTQGDLFASNFFSGTIHKISSGGIDAGDIITGLESPTGLAVDGSGSLYVAQGGLTKKITRYSSSGMAMGVFAATGIDGPLAIAFDPSWNLYVANFRNATVHKFSPSGLDMGDFITDIEMPMGLAFDQLGNLFVSTYAGTIRKYGSDGASMGTLVTGLSYPGSLVVDPQTGDIYVPNYGNGLIHHYSGAGEFIDYYGGRTGVPWGIATLPMTAVAEPSSAISLMMGISTLGLVMLRRGHWNPLPPDRN